MSKHDARAVLPLTQTEKRMLRKRLNEQAQSVLFRHPDAVRNLKSAEIRKAMQSLLPKGAHTDAIREWEEFYKKAFGVDVELSKVVVPKAPRDFTRLIVIAQGITLNAAIKACRERFPTWIYYDDLDAKVTKNERTNVLRAYAFWVRDRVEADEGLANLSADQLQEQKIACVTFLERILMELHFFQRTGGHLDIKNVTLCAGSRSSDGHVPSVHWRPDSGGLFVGWCGPDSRYPYLRGRAAVS